MRSFLLAAAVVVGVIICVVAGLVVFYMAPNPATLVQPPQHFVLRILATEGAEAAELIARVEEVIGARFDRAGILHTIERRSQDQLAASLRIPSEHDVAFARALMTTPAFLELRMVHSDSARLTDELFKQALSPPGYSITHLEGRDYYVADPTTDQSHVSVKTLRELERFAVPSPAYSFMLEKRSVTQKTVYMPIFVNRRRALSGEHIRDAHVDYSGLGQPVISIRFDSLGAKKFAGVTADYAPGGARNADPGSRRRLAIVIDGRVYSSPTIMEAIHGGKAQISGNFSLGEAQVLASLLAGGALPCPVEIAKDPRDSS